MLDVKDKVVYQIYPRSFMDSDGDGIGDLKGITMKLDYLQKLGVDYLWLTPFFVSPQVDNGYDVADYRRIDPKFGTMDDFEELTAEAKKHGIGIMLDMVFNHTSSEHEWFKKALSGEEKYMDYYIFKDSRETVPPTDWESKFGGSAWKYVSHLKKWYLHLFDEKQPDLNWANPAVREELKDVLCFWKAKGVEGFRFDVVNLISKADYENDSMGDGRSHYTDGPFVHDYLKKMVRDAELSDMITVGEMSSTSLDNCIRYSGESEHELSMVFHFQHLKVDYKDGDKWSLMPPDLQELGNLFRSWQEGMQEHHAWDALFWDNHDQPRAVSRFGNEKEYWDKSAKMLAGLIHLMRGTPYIYQGDEIGMTNAHFHDISRYKDVESRNYFEILKGRGLSDEEAIHIIDERSRDNGRTPMQWNDGLHAGFTSGEPWIDVTEGFDRINAESQFQDEDSIFNFYRNLITLRKEHTIISDGSIRFDENCPEGVISYFREYEGDKLLVWGNMTDQTMITASNGMIEKDEILLQNYTDMPLLKNDMVILRPFEFLAVILANGKGCR